MEEAVTFMSDGLALAGVLDVPDRGARGERQPAFIMAHGFGSNKESGSVMAVVAMLGAWGYVTLRFDMRGCGESDGEKGRIICLEQVADTQAAITYLQGRAEVNPARIGLIGTSFGGAVVLQTGAVDNRVGAVISSGGWGHGERKFRGQHPTPEMWKKFTDLIAAGREHRARTGRSLMASRYDIVPVPEHLRKNVIAGSVDEMPVDTAISMFEFKPEEVIGRLAPRPLLLLHSSVDSVTPSEQSIALFSKAGQPKDLHLFNETDHFMFAERNPRVEAVIKGWLDVHFPGPGKGKGS